jgi:hypothetical protein
LAEHAQNCYSLAEHARKLVTCWLSIHKNHFGTPHRFSEFSSVPPVTCSSVPFSHPCLTSYVPCPRPMSPVPVLCPLSPSYAPCLTSLFLVSSPPSLKSLFLASFPLPPVLRLGSLSLDLCPKSLFLVSRPLYHISRNCPVSHLPFSVP